MLNSDVNRKFAISHFPVLQNDSNFVIDGDADASYNCIAWAACVDNEWWEAIPEEKRPIFRFDGTTVNWPYNAPNNMKRETLEFIFSKKGYEACENCEYEDGFRKICLYGTPDVVTHAARQHTQGKYKGFWTSKLGQSFRIIHGTPYTIEGKAYGNVIGFMKSKWP
jgi:hypothetical protein